MFINGPEILARQHFDLSKKVFKDIGLNFGAYRKTDNKSRNKIYQNLENGKIDLLIGTHALFQKKIKFKKLGLVVIDEQHKFGVKQRSDLAKKGEINVMFCSCPQHQYLEQ